MFKHFIKGSKGKIPFSGRLFFHSEDNKRELNIEWSSMTRHFGTGFKFKTPQKNFFLKSLKKALSCFHQTQTWKKLMLNGMDKDKKVRMAAQQ